MADPIYEKMLKHIENSVNEQGGGVHLAGEFGVFGYDDKDENVYCQHYNTEEEAIEDAKLLSQEEGREELTYVEVWQANEEGEFGGIEGSNLIWKSDAPENESKVGCTLFVYDINANVLQELNYDDEEEAKAAALEYIQDAEKDKDIASVFVIDNETGSVLWKRSIRESKVNEEDIAERKLSDYSEKELQGLMSKLSQIQKVFPDVSSKMDKVQDELTRRGQAKEESKDD